jgi:hypothetical protein
MQRTNVALAVLFQTTVVGDLRRRRYRPFARRRTELSGPTGVCVGVGADADRTEDIDMGLGRGLLLWLIGVPIPIILLIALLWHH